MNAAKRFEIPAVTDVSDSKGKTLVIQCLLCRIFYIVSVSLDILSTQTRGFVPWDKSGNDPMEDFEMSAKKNNRSASVAAVSTALVVLALAAPAAWAKKTSIDFSAPGVFGSSTGLSVPLYLATCGADALNGAVDSSCSLDLTGDKSAEIALGFDLSISGTSYSSLFINENGFVTFGAGASAAAQNSTSFDSLKTALGGTSFLAPAVADFTTGNSNPFDYFNDGTGIYYQRGLGVLGDGPYFENDPRATDAFNVIWLTDVGGERFISQLVLYSLGAGDFAAQYNYGDPNPALAGGFGGYSVGSSSLSFGNQFDDALAPYLFRAGGDPPATDVPEPGTLALFGLGLLGVALTSRRRVRATALNGPAVA